MHLHWFALTLALTPSLASAALFPSNTLVKQIDAKGFKAAMKENVRGTTFLALSGFTYSPNAAANERRGIRSALVWGTSLHACWFDRVGRLTSNVT